MTADPAPHTVPAEVVAAAVSVLAEWNWSQRPRAVIRIGSTRRAALIGDLARALSSIGRLTDLGEVAVTGAPGTGRTNSAQRLRSVWSRFSLPEELAAQLAGDFRAAPVLLLDDYTDSGWTLAVVTRLLRRAGAGTVHPFVLGVTG